MYWRQGRLLSGTKCVFFFFSVMVAYCLHFVHQLLPSNATPHGRMLILDFWLRLRHSLGSAAAVLFSTVWNVISRLRTGEAGFRFKVTRCNLWWKSGSGSGFVPSRPTVPVVSTASFWRCSVSMTDSVVEWKPAKLQELCSSLQYHVTS